MKKIVKKIAAALLVCIMAVSVCACSEETVDAEAMVSEVFEGIKSYDSETINQYVDVERYIDTEEGDGLFTDEKTLAETMFSNLSYEVTSSLEVNPGMINVNVLVTNIDMSRVAESFAKKVASYVQAYPYVTDEELNNKMKEFFMDSMSNADDSAYVTMEIAVRVEETDGKWEIVPATEIENAVMGGLLDVVEEIQSAQEADEGVTEAPEEE